MCETRSLCPQHQNNFTHFTGQDVLSQLSAPAPSTRPLPSQLNHQHVSPSSSTFGSPRLPSSAASLLRSIRPASVTRESRIPHATARDSVTQCQQLQPVANNYKYSHTRVTRVTPPSLPISPQTCHTPRHTFVPGHHLASVAACPRILFIIFNLIYFH